MTNLLLNESFSSNPPHEFPPGNVLFAVALRHERIVAFVLQNLDIDLQADRRLYSTALTGFQQPQQGVVRVKPNRASELKVSSPVPLWAELELLQRLHPDAKLSTGPQRQHLKCKFELTADGER